MKNPIFLYKLSEDNTIPYYLQLLSILRRLIRSNTLRPGDMIPSEIELCEHFGISRSTVRQALNTLSDEGLIIRRRGKGTFVSSPKLKRNLDCLYNFSQYITEMGLVPKSKVLSKEVIPAPYDILKTLQLPKDNTQVMKLCRLRLANNEPILLETTYIPLYLCPKIYEEDFGTNSLYSLLRENYCLDLSRAIETYEPIILSRDDAKLLNCGKNTPGFSIERIGYLDNEKPYELTYSINRGDKSYLTIELWNDGKKPNFSRKFVI